MESKVKFETIEFPILINRVLMSRKFWFKVVAFFLRATINNREYKFKNKVREKNTRFMWFDKLSTVIIIVYHRIAIVDYLY